MIQKQEEFLQRRPKPVTANREMDILKPTRLNTGRAVHPAEIGLLGMQVNMGRRLVLSIPVVLDAEQRSRASLPRPDVEPEP